MPILQDTRTANAISYFSVFTVYSLHILSLTRKWKVTDATGRANTITGPGVVGEQPLIPPGGAFQYTSACPLNTVNGVMVSFASCRS
jgi:uncharacterized protein affecting Mg2+/Co2+ transport